MGRQFTIKTIGHVGGRIVVLGVEEGLTAQEALILTRDNPDKFAYDQNRWLVSTKELEIEAKQQS